MWSWCDVNYLLCEMLCISYIGIIIILWQYHIIYTLSRIKPNSESSSGRVQVCSHDRPHISSMYVYLYKYIGGCFQLCSACSFYFRSMRHSRPINYNQNERCTTGPPARMVSFATRIREMQLCSYVSVRTNLYSHNSELFMHNAHTYGRHTEHYCEINWSSITTISSEPCIMAFPLDMQ